MNRTFFIETYGCQMNVADSELVAGILRREGYREAPRLEQADAIFVNTCAIREHAQDKVNSRLGIFQRIKTERPEVLIGVLGCMAQSLKHQILETKPYVDIILGPDAYRRLPDLLQRRAGRDGLVDTRLSRFEVYDDLFPSRREGLNAWISIMRGCDKFCTFCIVPFTRGRERSRSVQGIVREAARTVREGFIEVTLLGQNVNSYNHNGQRFHVLLENVARIAGLKRIRFTSPHPRDMDTGLLHTMAAHDNICKSIHLPLQAGSDRILKRMNRTYTRRHFLELVDRIRGILPGVGLSTDIIVGFPGETAADLQDTLEVMEMVRFDSAFTFKYSSRPGTKAMEYSDQVAESEKQARLEQVIALQKRHTLENNRRLIGKTETVLVEKSSKRSAGEWAGRTDTNKWVIFPKGQARIRDLVPVRITDATGVSLHGTLMPKEPR